VELWSLGIFGYISISFLDGSLYYSAHLVILSIRTWQWGCQSFDFLVSSGY